LENSRKEFERLSKKQADENERLVNEMKEKNEKVDELDK
jgi:hypothetical protein